jgi:hypothetical protein
MGLQSVSEVSFSAELKSSEQKLQIMSKDGNLNIDGIIILWWILRI